MPLVYQSIRMEAHEYNLFVFDKTCIGSIRDPQ